MAYSYSTNIKYAVRFQSTCAWGGFVTIEFHSVFSEPFINDEIFLCKKTVIVRLPVKI